MRKNIKFVPVKFVVSSTMKAKLKATAALNDMTLGDMFMDAVLEKYPFLKTKLTEDTYHPENKLTEISDELKHLNNQKLNINR